ncbi:MAG: hypothetical protein HDT14_05310 [Oscillibacter sp.]|nr:hypothetical protein [Oscillibacter sp.]
MNDIQKKIEEAHRMVSVIAVSGDAVDVMAGARIKLKEAFQLAGDKSALWEAHKLAEQEKEKKKEKEPVGDG